MSGDYSRRRFDKTRDFTAVFNQQGRVQLDSDWNEHNEILSRRMRAETVGTIGRAVVPSEDGQNEGAFKIVITPGLKTLSIGPGRIYVDGLLAENHGSGDLSKKTVRFDAVLEEDKALDPIAYDSQPYLPNAKAVAPLPRQGGQYATYLDVWQREVTFLERPELVENAVGVDTTTRMQTVWQVKLLQDSTGASCDTALPETLTRPSGGRISTAAVGVQTVTDPCLIPPTGGYRGLENRLYRVEIHDGGTGGPNGATFKWSRDNASMATSVTSISGDLLSLTVSTVARDSIMRFAVGDWIEITDDWLEFASQPGLPNEKRGGGVMARVKNIVLETLTIELFNPLPASIFPATLDPQRHTRVRRWDQQGKVFDTKGNLLVDLDAAASTGVIPVPLQGTSIVLEDGVQITFDTENTDAYHVADYWNFVARTADASVETLDRAAPKGVHHHFCRLAMLSIDPHVSPTDCRTLWPPTCASCECTVCVSVDQFNKDKNSLQAAIDGLLKTGGKLCLGPGVYSLPSTLNVNSPTVSIHISGRGQSTVLVQPQTGPAMSITGGGITIEDLQVWTQSPGPNIAGGNSMAAFAVADVFDFCIQRCWVAPFPSSPPISPTGAAVQLSGTVINATIRDNTFVAQDGIVTGRGVGILKTFNLEVLDNEINANTVTIQLSPVFSAASTRISGNKLFVVSVVGSVVGVEIISFGAIESRLELDSNYILVASNPGAGVPGSAFGIMLGDKSAGEIAVLGSTTRVANNDIFVNWGLEAEQLPEGMPGAAGIAVINSNAFEHLIISGNSVHGAPSDPKSIVPWNSLIVTVQPDALGLQLCEIQNNVFEALPVANYQAVSLQISGDCAFVGNQCTNDNRIQKASASDVSIAAGAIVASNNIIRGVSLDGHVSLQLFPIANLTGGIGSVTVLGNICSAPIHIRNNTLAGTAWGPLNIPAV